MPPKTIADVDPERLTRALFAFQKDPEALRAILLMQRWWRRKNYSWLYSSPKVELPYSPSDLPALPLAAASGSTDVRTAGVAWHLRLMAAFRKVKAAVGTGVGRRLHAELEYCKEVGKFATSCRACAVLCAREATLDPHGLAEELGDTAALDSPKTLPRRLLPSDPMWPLVRPRFDGDRVYAFDSIIVTLVGGNVTGRANEGFDHEGAWKLYGHDAKGMQALADAIMAVSCSNLFVPPVCVLVDYLGFRAFCRPQALKINGAGPEFVLGPLEEAAASYGDRDDLPALLSGESSEALGLLLNEWDCRNPSLRLDLENLGHELSCLGYPIALVSDLPAGCSSTVCLRIHSEGEAEYHFRTPAELVPPEVFPDTQRVDPVKRLRREALSALNAPPLPPTLRGSGLYAASRTTGAAWPSFAADALTLNEVSARVRGQLPRELLQRLGEEGPPLDSRGWSEAFHAAGVNMRYLGLAAESASFPAASALSREALARAAKWQLRKALWSKLPWSTLAAANPLDESAGAVQVAVAEVVALFNLVLGSGIKVERYWAEYLVPEAVRRFNIPAAALARRKVIPRALFHAMEHHCKVRFRKSAQGRPFFNPGFPTPLREGDLEVFQARYAAPLFPHLGILKKHWLARLERREAYGLAVPLPAAQATKQWIGFYPETTICCTRGVSFSAAIAASARHVADGHWEKVCEAKKLELTIIRALGENTDVVGNVVQGIAVALLETSQQADAEGVPTRRAGHDPTLLRDALYTADAAFDMLPTCISAWWAQLAAVEAEWFMDKTVNAQARLQRMRRDWHRCAGDQPVLVLRLEGTIVRHFAAEANWPRAAFYTERCCSIAESAFGKTHPATLALKARVGDCWARHEDWARSASAYQRALASAEAAGDEASVSRLSYELARVLYLKGDLAASKPFAEQAVKLLLPKFWDRGAIVGGVLGVLGVEALHLLAQVYEAVCLRAGTGGSSLGIPNSTRVALIDRTIRCYENYLRHLPLETRPRASGLTRPAEIIESIVRLKALCMGVAERAELIEQIEELILSNSLSVDGDDTAPGERAVQPKAQIRAIAEAALQSRSDERSDRLVQLYEAVAREAIVNFLDPSDWFDDVVRKMQEGVAGGQGPETAAYQATLSLLDIVRYFGIYAPGGISLRQTPH